MTVKELIDIEKSNTNRIILHSEGMFWRAYEISAYLFCTHIKPFKPMKKYVKSVNDDIISIGFPKNQKYFEGMNVTELEGNRVEITGDYKVGGVDDPGFINWKESVAVTQSLPQSGRQKPPQPQQKEPPCAVPEGKISLELQIARFNLESKTPLECMDFIAKLKREIVI